MSPKEHQFRKFVEFAYETDELELSVEAIANNYYGLQRPVYWRQATIATMARLIKMLEKDPSSSITLKRLMKKGRGHIIKYEIIEK